MQKKQAVFLLDKMEELETLFLIFSNNFKILFECSCSKMKKMYEYSSRGFNFSFLRKVDERLFL